MQGRMSALTELDLCVLGVIWRSGPLSAYRVRTQFRDSTTAAWSSSSGSIYPSIRRLREAGLIAASSSQDRRGTQTLELTNAGRDRLREWLVNLPPEVGTATPDPIRTRAQFLTSVAKQDRLHFTELARGLTQLSLASLEAEAEQNRDDQSRALDQLGTIAAIMELRARLDWLELVLDFVRSRE